MKRFALILSVLALAACAACLGSDPAALGPEEVLVLEVAAQRVSCVGEMSGECLQVREPGEEEWRTFHSAIEGFQHEEGVRYTLEVGRRERLNPPADAGSYAYRLIRIIEQEVAQG